ncbi:Uncharacterized protein dnl_21370 [Desulfonema limicola]|uniref:Uncharacterized protein n=1 Tax=Desulfonema limicola TaxID=45656 RepID=A0A975B6S3_9BACT|nr:hypothetical protein [Desulfonema limicola]QTA79855.1 Uncharacterized protein dnl_21370 [Desulfonema limicola]
MIPVYFPFTYVSKQAADLLSTCFDKTIVYQSSSNTIPEFMTKMADQGFLDIRIPENSDEEKLAGVIQEYKNWAQVHKGGKMSFFKTQTGTTPFYDEISPHHIISDIKKKQNNEISEQMTDPVLQARIFLSIAQEFDENYWELSNGLESVSVMEKALIEQIKGDNDLDNINSLTPNQALTKDEPGSHMTEQRLKSWTRLLIGDPEKSNFYITTSRNVMETLLEDSQEMEKVLIQAVSNNPDSDEWKKDLSSKLENISIHAVLEKDLKPLSVENNAGFLTIYRIPREPYDFFSWYLNKGISPNNDKILETKEKYTLIGLMEMV